MGKSTRTKSAGKSAKPYPEFPLTAHVGSGQWCKKFRGDSFYFGPLADWKAAHARFEREWPYRIQGKTPPAIDTGDGLTVRDLCNAFIVHKQNRMQSGELSAHSYAGYFRACESLIGYFGEQRHVSDLRPDDFERFRAHLADGCNVVTLLSKINRIRVVLKFASDNEMVDRPVSYSKAFDRPAAKSIRAARNDAGERMFEADEVRRIIEASGQPLKAMVLLGINCGFGNTDVSSLPQSALDLKGGWVEFPRPKTAVKRRVPLWPETVAALKAAIATRPPARNSDDAGLCFLTSRRTRFVRVKISKTGKHVTINSLSRRFEGLLDRLTINGRQGLNFYTLRHVFETVGGESRDQIAVDACVGHVDSSMGGQYRERISDERLRAVTDHVRRWLWPKRK